MGGRGTSRQSGPAEPSAWPSLRIPPGLAGSRLRVHKLAERSVWNWTVADIVIALHLVPQVSSRLARTRDGQAQPSGLRRVTGRRRVQGWNPQKTVRLHKQQRHGDTHGLHAPSGFRHSLSSCGSRRGRLTADPAQGSRPTGSGASNWAQLAKNCSCAPHTSMPPLKVCRALTEGSPARPPPSWAWSRSIARVPLKDDARLSRRNCCQAGLVGAAGTRPGPRGAPTANSAASAPRPAATAVCVSPCPLGVRCSAGFFACSNSPADAYSHFCCARRRCGSQIVTRDPRSRQGGPMRSTSAPNTRTPWITCSRP